MNAASALAAASSLVWLGMLLGISFLEAPLKFRAPGITLPLGLGIGRLVFRALNAAEHALAATLTLAVLTSTADTAAALGWCTFSGAGERLERSGGFRMAGCGERLNNISNAMPLVFSFDP